MRRTISEFRKHHLQALARLFVQVLKLAEAAGVQAFFVPGIAQQSKAKTAGFFLAMKSITSSFTVVWSARSTK